ncbi:hypothetical protein HYH03_001535 [Edaphochlamys debaryana]|uniref:Uncharacterized protein n=1 Tax=Edaphochlamys debaryana TaxID=47281 RepID=A0A836C656_9CHLO|nr:hypothetical protein HYH03_001535 [Edaphochlamys debaryana]|eukprot:KAG2500773.1 hypothetical protein HYH03_001535 [Edaphochlamys debaryana]
MSSQDELLRRARELLQEFVDADESAAASQVSPEHQAESRRLLDILRSRPDLAPWLLKIAEERIAADGRADSAARLEAGAIPEAIALGVREHAPAAVEAGPIAGLAIVVAGAAAVEAGGPVGGEGSAAHAEPDVRAELSRLRRAASPPASQLVTASEPHPSTSTPPPPDERLVRDLGREGTSAADADRTAEAGGQRTTVEEPQQDDEDAIAPSGHRKSPTATPAANPAASARRLRAEAVRAAGGAGAGSGSAGSSGAVRAAAEVPATAGAAGAVAADADAGATRDTDGPRPSHTGSAGARRSPRAAVLARSGSTGPSGATPAAGAPPLLEAPARAAAATGAVGAARPSSQLELQLDMDVDMDAAAPSGRESPAPTPAAAATDNAGRGAEADKAAAGGAGAGSGPAGPSGAPPAAEVPPTAAAAGAAAAGTAGVGRTGAAGPSSQPAAGPLAAAAKAGEAARGQGSDVVMEGASEADEDEAVAEEEEEDDDGESPNLTWYYYGHPVRGMSAKWPGLTEEMREGWCNEFRARVKTTALGGSVTFTPAHKETRRELLKAFLRLIPGGPLDAAGPTADAGADEQAEEEDEGSEEDEGGEEDVAEEEEEEEAPASSRADAAGVDGEEGDGPVDRAAVAAAMAELAAANAARIAAALAARPLPEPATGPDAAAADGAAAEAGGAEGAAAAAAVGGRRKKGAPTRRADAAAAAEAAEAAADDPPLAARVEGILRATGTEESLLPAATRNLVRELVGQMSTGAGAGGSGAAGRLDQDALSRLLARLGAEVERLREAWAQSRERLQLRAHAVSHWTEARQPTGAAAVAFAAIASGGASAGAAAKPSTKADAWRQELERQQALVGDVCREVADKYRSDEAGLERDLKKYVSVLSVYVSRSEQLRLLLALAGGSRQEAAEAQAEARAELRAQRGAGAAGGGSSKGKGKQAGAAAANGGGKAASSEDDDEEGSEADGSYDSSFIDDDGAEGQAGADAEGGAAAADGEGQGDEDEGSPAGPNAATGLAPNQTEVLLGFRALDRQRQQAQAQAEAQAEAEAATGQAQKDPEPQGPRKPRGKGKPTRAPDTAPAAAEDAMEVDGGAAAPGPAAAAADANGTVAMETDGSGGAAAGSTDGEDAGEAETEGEAASQEGSDEEDAQPFRTVPLLQEAFSVGSAVDFEEPPNFAKAAPASPAAAAGGGAGSSNPGGPDKRREPPRTVLAKARERAGEPAFRLWQTGGRVIGASRAGRRGVRYTVAVPSGREGDDDDVCEVQPQLLRPAALGQPGAPSAAVAAAGVPVLKRGLLLQQFRRGGWRPALVLAASKHYAAASGGRTWAELRQHLPPAPRKAPPPNPNAPRSEGGSSWSGWPWARVEYKRYPPVRNFTRAESDRLPPAWANRPRASERTAGHVADVREFGDASYVNALPPLPAQGTTDVPQYVTHVQLLDFRGYLETPTRGKALLRPHVHNLTNDQLVNERLAAPLLWWHAKQTWGSEGQWTRVPADPVLARLEAGGQRTTVEEPQQDDEDAIAPSGHRKSPTATPAANPAASARRLRAEAVRAAGGAGAGSGSAGSSGAVRAAAEVPATAGAAGAVAADADAGATRDTDGPRPSHTGSAGARRSPRAAVLARSGSTGPSGATPAAGAPPLLEAPARAAAATGAVGAARPSSQLELQLDMDVDMDAAAPSGRESPAPTPAAAATDNAGRGAEADKAAAGGAGAGSGPAGPSGAPPAAEVPPTAAAAGAAAAGTAGVGRTGAAGPSSQPAAGPLAAAAKAGEAARGQGSDVVMEGASEADEDEAVAEEEEEDDDGESPNLTWYYYGHPVRGMSAKWPGLTEEMREGWCNEFRARVKTTALGGSVTFTPAHKETRRELLKAFLRLIPGGPLDAAGPTADAGADEQAEEEDEGSEEDEGGEEDVAEEEEEEEAPASSRADAAGVDGEEGDGPVDRAAVAAAMAELAAANAARIAAALAARPLPEPATGPDAAAADGAAAEAGGAEGAAAAAAVGGRRKKGAPTRRADAAAAAEAAEAAADDPPLAARVEGILRATGTEESLLPAATRNLVRELVGQMSTGAGAGGSGAAGRLDQDALSRLLARLGAEVERLREAWAQSRERLQLRAHAVSHWTEARQPTGAAAVAFAAIASGGASAGAAAKPSTKADAWRQELERQQALVGDVCREVADKYRSDEAGLERDLKKYVSVLSVYVSRSEQLRLLLALAGGSRQEAAEAQAEARAELRAQRGAGAAGGGSSKGKGKQAGAAAANGGGKAASSEDDDEEGSEADGSYDSSFIDDDGAEGQAGADAEGGAAAADGEGQGDEDEGSPAGPNAATGLAPNQTEVLLGFPPAAAEDAMEVDGGAAAPGPAAAAADANGTVAMETDGSGGAAAGSTDGEDAGEAETEGEAASQEGSDEEDAQPFRTVPLLQEAFSVGSAVDFEEPPNFAKAAPASPAAAAGGGAGSSNPGGPDKRREPPRTVLAKVQPQLLRPAALGQPGAPSAAVAAAGVPVLKRGLLLQQFRRGGWRPALVLAASKHYAAASGGRTWAELRQHLPPAPRKAPPPNPNAPRSEGGSSWSGWPWARVEYKRYPPVRNFTRAESDRLPPAWANRPRASERTAGHVADVREFGDASYVNALPPLPAQGTTDVPQYVTHVQLLDFRGYLETPTRGKALLRPHVHNLTNDQLVNERLAAPLLWWHAKQTWGSEGQWTRVPADPVLARLGFHVGGIITDYRLRQKVTKLKEDAGADAAGGPQAASALRSLQARTVARALARRPSADVESTHKVFGPPQRLRRQVCVVLELEELPSRQQLPAGAAEEQSDEGVEEAGRRGCGGEPAGQPRGASRKRPHVAPGEDDTSSSEDVDDGCAADHAAGSRDAGLGGGRARSRGRGRGHSGGPPPAKKVKENVQKARLKRKANVPLREAEEDQGGRRLFQDRAEPKLPACIAGRLKGHQLEGLRFMWECLVDVHQKGGDLADSAGGCILAHSMGLGKTLSTIALIHMFLGRGMGQGQGPAGPGPFSSAGGSGPSQDPGDGLEGRRRALLVVPANVLHNFYIELRAWLPEEGSEDEALSRLTIKKVYMWQNDPEVIQRWHSEEGSVLIATSGKLRHLVLVPGSGGGGAPEGGAPGSAVAAPKRRGRPPRPSAPPAVPAPEAVAAAEAAEGAEGAEAAGGEDREEGEDPEAELPTGEAAATRKTELRRMVLEGCGLVVVDEAHELRNPTSQLYKAMCLVATQRRLALTGYPLQNNLSEYYTMLNWVQPDLLGTPEDFKRNYASVIEKAQTKKASASDRRRANIHLQLLRDATDAFIHRAGPEILEAELPPKSEVVFLLDMNERQREFYRGYLELLTECGEAPQLFRDFAMLSRLLNQPHNFERLMQQAAEAGGSGTVELEGAEAEEGEGLRLQLSPARPNTLRRATPPAAANPEATTVAAPAPRPPLAPAGDAPGAATQLLSPLVQRQLSFGAAAAAEAAETGAVAEGAGPSTAGAGPETAAGGRATGPRRGKKRDTGAGSKEDDHIVQFPFLLVERLHERFKALRAEATQGQAEGQQGVGGGGGGGGSDSAGPDVDPLWGPLPKTLFVQKLLRICQEAGERLVFFTQSLGVLNDVQKRQEAIDEFNAFGRARVMLVSSKAGFLGINLTSACRLVIVDVPWNPVYNAQAIARIFRMGQVRPTYVYRLLYAATLEELVYDLNVDKEELFVKVVDKKSVRKDHAALAKRWSYEAPPRMSSEDALHRLQGLAAGAAGAGGAAGGSADAEGAGRDTTLLQLAQDPEVRAPLVNAFPAARHDMGAAACAADLAAAGGAAPAAAVAAAAEGADAGAHAQPQAQELAGASVRARAAAGAGLGAAAAPEAVVFGGLQMKRAAAVAAAAVMMAAAARGASAGASTQTQTQQLAGPRARAAPRTGPDDIAGPRSGVRAEQVQSVPQRGPSAAFVHAPAGPEGVTESEMGLSTLTMAAAAAPVVAVPAPAAEAADDGGPAVAGEAAAGGSGAGAQAAAGAGASA